MPNQTTTFDCILSHIEQSIQDFYWDDCTDEDISEEVENNMNFQY